MEITDPSFEEYCELAGVKPDRERYWSAYQGYLLKLEYHRSYAQAQRDFDSRNKKRVHRA